MLIVPHGSEWRLANPSSPEFLVVKDFYEGDKDALISFVSSHPAITTVRLKQVRTQAKDFVSRLGTEWVWTGTEPALRHENVSFERKKQLPQVRRGGSRDGSPRGRASPRRSSPRGRASPGRSSPRGRASPRPSSPHGRASPERGSPFRRHAAPLLRTPHNNPLRARLSAAHRSAPLSRVDQPQTL